MTHSVILCLPYSCFSTCTCLTFDLNHNSVTQSEWWIRKTPSIVLFSHFSAYCTWSRFHHIQDMAVLPVNIGRNGRRRLGGALSLLNLLVAIGGVLMTLPGLFIMFFVDRQMSALDGYKIGPLSTLLIVSGAIVLFNHLLGAKICYDCGFDRKRNRFMLISLKIFIVANIILMSYILVLGIIAPSNFRHVTDKVFLNTMSHYTNIVTKEAVNTIQREYSCCGSQGYKDWFSVMWFTNITATTQNQM